MDSENSDNPNQPTGSPNSEAKPQTGNTGGSEKMTTPKTPPVTNEEETKKAEQKKKEEEAKKAEQKKKEEEAKKAEQKKKEEEAKKAEQKKEEETKKAEQKKEDETKKADQQKKKEEKKMETKIKRQPYKLSGPLRLFNLIAGIVFVALALYALANEELTVSNTVLILSIILGLSGVSRLINAFYDKNIGGTKRLIRFIIGAFLLLISITVLIDFGFGQDLLFMLLAIGLFLQGLGRISLVFSHKGFPIWIKIIQFITGIASIVLGLAVFIPSVVELDFDVDLLLLLVIGFFISGLSRFMMGLVGLGEQKTT